MEENKSKVAYRIEPEKTFDITTDHAERRARARLIISLRNSLFGKNRYQTLILNSAFNNLFNSLRVAKFLNSKVPELAMIIKFVPFIIVETLEDKTTKNITRRRIEIRLTTKPTEEDKQQPGYNPGLSKQQIQDPIEGIFERRQRQYKNNNNRRGGQRQGGRRQPQQRTRHTNYRANRGDQLSEDQDDRKHSRRPQQRNRQNERQQGKKYVSKSRGGSKGGNTIGQREQTQHNYSKNHLKN